MKKQLFTFIITIAFSFGAFAQSYVYTTTTGTSDAFDIGEVGTTIMEEPSTSGTSLPDQMSGLISLPFSWDFYGSAVTGYYVSDNGFITFDNSVTSTGTNDTPPSASGPNAAIYAWWDDIDIYNGPGSTDKVKYWTYGEAPDRVHVIQWHSVTAGDPGVTIIGSFTSAFVYASIRIYECGDFDIIHPYGGSEGWTATVGCENTTGTDATLVPGSPTLDYPAANNSASTDDVVHRFYYGSQPTSDITVIDETGLSNNILAGNQTLTGTLENLGSATVTSFDLHYTIDGASTVTSAISSVSIASGGSYTYSHPTAFSAGPAGVFHDIKIWASNINGNTDELPCNDTLEKSVFVYTGTSTSRQVLIEEFTGAWCGYCPDGHTKSDNLMNTYPNVSAVMIHAGTATDAMKFTESLDIAAEFSATSFPGAMIDRVLFDGFDKVPHTRSNSNWENHTAERVNAYSPVDVSISKSYNSATRVIDATVTADFVDYAAGDIRINLFVVEDNVTGTGSGYDQANYLNTTPGSPFEGLGNPIVGYNHRHVLRAVPSGVPGTSGVIPGIVSPGGE
ncbi:MAG TPA: Omp28-related outer membrane protein, partial [Flavobacteriales bacterium]|nr:Omp28-related outer membrane protein [Flavobacteriales bacterium]